MAEMGMLTGGLAHEIKNPLSTLQLNLQLLQEDLEAQADALPRPTAPATDVDQRGKLAGRMQRRLNSVQSETVRLREILDDFLRYAGQIHVEARPTQMYELCEDLVDFVLPQAHVARVALKLEGSALAAEIDPRLVKQALLNLLLNALQHTPAEGRVTLRCESAVLPKQEPTDPARPGVALRVVDTGEGMDEATMAKVLQPYFSRRRGGTGLGLAVTRRIAEAHSGHIEVQSTPGEGSTFSLLLPLQAPPADAEPVAMEASTGRTP